MLYAEDRIEINTSTKIINTNNKDMTEITSDILKVFKNFRTCGLKKILENKADKTTFFFRKGMADRITQVSFEIDRGKDLYIVSFGKQFRKNYTQVKAYEDCYVDQLLELFEETTSYIAY